MEFKALSLTTFDNCMTFVLKRLGCKLEYASASHFFEQNEPNLLQVTDLSELEIGDILISKRKKSRLHYRYMEMDKEGRVFVCEINTSYHLYLCEGDYLSHYCENIDLIKRDKFKFAHESREYFLLKNALLFG